MKYNRLGKTNISVSQLGFGVARLPEIKVDKGYLLEKKEVYHMIDAAVERGINYFDSGDIYCHGQSQLAVSEVLKPYRENVYLANKVMPFKLKKKGDLLKEISVLLKQTEQEYFDCFYFWGINRVDFDNIILKYDFIREAEKARESGLIKHIGFSFHDAPDAMKYILDSSDVFEMVLCQYNLLDRTNEEIIKYAYQKDVGVLVMSPLAGGNLLLPKEYNGEKISVADALKFVVDNPYVSCTLTGTNSTEMLLENIDIVNTENTLTREERLNLKCQIDSLRQNADLFCTRCDYCQPCPTGINISYYFELYTLAKVYKLNKVALDSFHYFQNHGGVEINKCIKCGKCAKKCTQHIDIPTELRKVERFFKTLTRFYEHGKKMESENENI